MRPRPAQALVVLAGIATARKKAGALRADGLIAHLGINFHSCAALRAGMLTPFNWHRRPHSQAWRSWSGYRCIVDYVVLAPTAYLAAVCRSMPRSFAIR